MANIQDIISIGHYKYRVEDSKTLIFAYIVEGLKILKANGDLNLGQFNLSVTMRDPMIPLTGGLGKEIPCITINRIDDTVAPHGIGDVGGVEDIPVIETDETSKQEKVVYSIPFTEVFEIRVWGTTAEMRNDIYVALKKVCMGMIFDFEKIGIGLVQITAGKDEADHNFMPSTPIFWGSFNISLWNTIEFYESEKVLEIKEIKIETYKMSDIVIV